MLNVRWKIRFWDLKLVKKVLRKDLQRVMQFCALVPRPDKSKLAIKCLGNRPSIHNGAQSASKAIALIGQNQRAWPISDDRWNHN